MDGFEGFAASFGNDTTLSITTISILDLIVTFSILESQHNDTQNGYHLSLREVI
jgi:hypothetical protein